MAQLVVCDLEDDWIQELKVRAARYGRSAEEEHREILRRALAPRPKSELTIKELLLAMPDVGEDSDFERKSQEDRLKVQAFEAQWTK